MHRTRILTALGTAAATLGAAFTLGTGTAWATTTTNHFYYNGYKVAAATFNSYSTTSGHVGQESLAVADTWNDSHYIIAQLYDATTNTLVDVCTAPDLSSRTCYYNLTQGHAIQILVWRVDNATSRQLYYMGTVKDANGYLPRA